MSVSTQTPECTVVIINEIDTTARKLVLPSSVEEALKNCVALRQAVDFVEHLDCLELFGPALSISGAQSIDDEPLQVTVRKSADTIVVRWWACGDLEAALEKLHEIQKGGLFA